MENRYLFDKRDWKRRFIKYGIIFAISFFPIVILNIHCSKYFEKRWLLVFVDSMVLLIFVVIGNYFATKIFDKKDAKLERKQKERRELQQKKIKIMEDSYKKIRIEKEQKKKQQAELPTNKVFESIEEEKQDIKETNRSSSIKKKSNNSKGRK